MVITFISLNGKHLSRAADGNSNEKLYDKENSLAYPDNIEASSSKSSTDITDSDFIEESSASVDTPSKSVLDPSVIISSMDSSMASDRV